MSAAITCHACHDTGFVCEAHPERPWEGVIPAPSSCACGEPGMPCPTCCDLVPQDGTHSVLEAFIPRHLRAVAS